MLIFGYARVALCTRVPIIVVVIIFRVPKCGKIIAIFHRIFQQTPTRMTLIRVVRTIPTIDRTMNVFHNITSKSIPPGRNCTCYLGSKWGK